MYEYKYHKYKNKYLNLKNTKSNKKMNDPIFETTINYINDMIDTRNVNIVAMGEATHGQEKITKLRIKIFKQLAKKNNFTVFVLEEQYSLCELINDWIHNKSSFELDYLFKQLMWPWKSFQMHKLLIWMKKYNEANNNLLEFKGIDVQSKSPDYDAKDDISIYAENIVNKLNALNDTINSESGEDCFSLRDKSMFEIFMKIYDPNKKYFIHAHNGHLSKGRAYQDFLDLGYFLSKKFKTKYLVIGNSFNGRYYAGFDVSNNNYNFGIADFGGQLDFSKLIFYNKETDNYDLIDYDPNLILSDGLTTDTDVNFSKKYFVESGAQLNIANPYKMIGMYSANGYYDAIIQIPDEQAIKLYKN